MRQIEKYFISSCSSKYKEMGFTKKNLTFARISEDIIHSFTFRKSSFAPSCFIEFAVIPLCMPTPIYLDAGNYRLDNVVLSSPPVFPMWTFDPQSDESMYNCIESIIHAIDCYLIPFFNACTNCKLTLDELIKLEETIENNRIRLLQHWGTDDCGKPWQESSLFDPRKYYIALKSQNYSYAHKFLSYKILWYTQEIESIAKNEGVRQPEIVKLRFVADLAKYTEHIRRLEAHNYDFFDQLLHIQEIQLQLFLEEQYPQLFKKKTVRKMKDRLTIKSQDPN